MSAVVSQRSYRLNLDPATTRALAHFSRRRRVLLVLRAIAAGTVAWIASMLLLALCDYLWFLSDSVRWLMSLGGYAVTFIVMWWQGLGRLRRHDPKSLARQFESAEPRLREDLLSAVELADPNLANGSEGFREWLQRRVARRMAGIDIAQALPVGLLTRWLSTGMLAVTIMVVLLLIPEMQFGRRIARAMLPGLAIERASRTEVSILEPSPPSGYVAEGDAVAVVVRIAGATADQVTLRWRSNEGVEGETEMTPRISASASGVSQTGGSETGGSETGSEGTLAHNNVYAANLSVGSDPLDYQILAGDAITLWHTLTPLPRPRVEMFDKRYIFPHYAKLSDRVEQAEHGDLKALIGTTAEVTVRFDEPVDHAILRFGFHGAELPLNAVNDSKQEFVTSIPIKTPAQYQIDATSVRSGLNNPFSPQYAIVPVIDSPPVVRWSPSIPRSSLVSPLDVLSLAASASDDLPLDRVVQEFIVNVTSMLQREVPVAQSNRELDLQWEWDLMRRGNGEEQSIKLESGDIVRTRTVAIDRRGHRGESPWIELLVTDEGFDVNRHAPLERLASLTAKLSDWTTKAKELAEQIATVADANKSPDPKSLGEVADELHDSRNLLLTEIKSVLASSQTLPEAATLELSGRSLLDLDQKLIEIIGRWSDIRAQQHPAWANSQDKSLREIANESKRLASELTRLDQLARSAFGQQLSVSVASDVIALERSLRPLLDQQQPMPAVRFPRYLTVLIGRMNAIVQLIRQHEAVLPESTRKHFEIVSAMVGFLVDSLGRLD